MMQLPVTSAQTTLMLERMRGKFQGQMAATTPRGMCVAMTLDVASSCWISSVRAFWAGEGG